MREPDDEHDQNADPDASGAMYAVGYKRPPRHSSQQNLFRLAQQIGQFEEAPANLQRIERVIVQWKSSDDDRIDSPALPANSQVNSE